MRRCQACLSVALWISLALAGCGSDPIATEAAMPPLPREERLQLDELLPSVRQEIEGAYRQVSAQPNDAEMNGRLGILLHAHQRYEFAETLYRRAQLLEPSSFRWAYYLGLVQSATGKHEAARASLRTALDLDPLYVPAQLAIADVLLSLGEQDESERHYRAALEAVPDSAVAYFGLGRIQAARGDMVAAIRNHEKASELYPQFGAAHYALALAYRDLGRQQKADAHLAAHEKYEHQRPPAEDPLFEEVRKMQAGAAEYTRAGVEMVNAGKFAQAVELLEQAVSVDPRDEGAAVNLLIAYGHLGDAERAEKHYRRAAEGFPDSEQIHFNYAVIVAQQGKTSEASKLFSRVLEINPNHAEANANLGFLFEEDGNVDRAARHYQRAIRNQPNHPTARFRLGRLMLGRGDTQAAIEHFQAALKDRNEQADQSLYGLATAHAMRGDLTQAIRYGKQAREEALRLGHRQTAQAIEADLETFERRAAAQ